ncbi:MAG: pentapeptide repeat-containing protein [Calditrichota bacterium]
MRPPAASVGQTFLSVLLTVAIILSIFIDTDAYAEEVKPEKEWGWYERVWDSLGTSYHYVPRDRDDLQKRLDSHSTWLKSEGLEGIRLNLSFANLDSVKLRGVNLSSAYLYSAVLTNSDLSYSDLSKATLTQAKLSKSILNNINFSNAEMMVTDLTNSFLQRADLTGANLYEANLSGSNLVIANLSEAKLIRSNLTYSLMVRVNLSRSELLETDLTNANLHGANLDSVIFEPDSLPIIKNLAYAMNLDKVKYRTNIAPLAQLKASFDVAGYRRQSKIINTVLKRNNASFIETLLFDYTCEWGSNWFLPLKWLARSWLFFSFLYLFSLKRRHEPYLFLVTSKRGLKTEDDINKRTDQPADWTKLHNWWYHIFIAFVFSLHRTLRLGFRELNPAHWLQMFLPPEFEMKSRGWPRCVSAVQSLISVYLIALSLLSYFGRPFDY